MLPSQNRARREPRGFGVAARGDSGGIRWLPLAAAVLLCLALVSRSAAQVPNPRGGTPTGQHPPETEAQLDRLVHASMEAIYRTRLADARRLADEARRLAPNDPRVYILQARVLRESFPDQSTSSANLTAVAAPIHATLERAIGISDSLVAADERSPAGWLYRGWAHLFRAQMHTLRDEYWSAGRQAKAGKKDLDRALALSPGNPDAQGILGTYLYFADILPRVVKLARTVIRVPGGDRRLGLELLRASAAGGGYNRLDARVLLGVIAFAFDGDYDRAIADFHSFLQDYPDNPRLLEPLAVLEPMRPEKRDLDRIAALAPQFANQAGDFYREMSHRLTFYLALSELLQGRADDAVAHLDAVRRAAPKHPDWFLGDVTLVETEIRLLKGDGKGARSLAAAAQGKLQERLRFAADPSAAATPAEAEAFRAAQSAAQALYGGDLDLARTRVAALGAAEPAAVFYRGELARLEGAPGAAEAQFAKLVETALPPRWRLYKTLAFSRLAEQMGARGDAASATATLERALDFDADRDLFRHVIRARRRYWEMVRDGVLSSSRPATSAAPASDRNGP